MTALMPAGLEPYLSEHDRARLRTRLRTTESFTMPFRARFQRPGLQGLIVHSNGHTAWVEVVPVVDDRPEWSESGLRSDGRSFQ